MRGLRTNACALMLLLLASTAVGQQSEAAALFGEGRELMIEGRFEEACPKLEQSQALEPRVGTLLNLAVCHEKLGMLASAWVEFQRARDEAAQEGRSEQQVLAQERIDRLGPRVPWLRLAVADDARVLGLALSLDGVPVDPAEWGEALPIDPGEHVVVVAAPGHAPREQRLVIAEAEEKRLEVGRLERVEATVVPGPVDVDEPVDAPKAEPDARRRWVLEAGAFGGYLLNDGDRTRPTGSEASIELRRSDNNEVTSCAAATCDYTLGARGGFVFGVNLFAGYAATEWLHVGGRLIAGPRVGGGMVAASGPSLLFRVAGPFSLGVGAMLGSAAANGDGEAVAAPPYFPASTERVEMSSGIELAFGPMLELELEMFSVDEGAFVFVSTPMVLFGQGTAFSLPLGVAFRFQ